MIQPFADIAPWPPQRWTQPLAENFTSAFDGYRDAFRVVWKAAFGYTLECWQETTLRHILEIYPPGHKRAGQLRWRQVVISLGRQNGKSEIAAALGLWGLLMKRAPTVIGIASSVDQARLVYDRTSRAALSRPELRQKIRKPTRTRGIQTTDGGSYDMKASKTTALQGIPIDVGLVDELHILPRALWFDLVNGLGGRPNCLVVGITTAGDDDSELLIHLYEQGDQAITAGDEARFGFFCWQSLNAAIPDDDDELGRELARGNPSVASGRTDLENAVVEVRSMPADDAIRYRLNQFTARTSTFMSAQDWNDNRTDEPYPDGVRPTFVLDRTKDWRYGNIGVFGLMPDSRIYCDLAAVLVKPTQAQFVDLCTHLNTQHDPVTFAVDPMLMKDVGKALEERGLPVTYVTQADVLNGSALLYSKIKQRKLAHPGNQLLTNQIPAAKRRDSDGGFKISRKESKVAIDGVMTHLIGVQIVETALSDELQIF